MQPRIYATAEQAAEDCARHILVLLEDAMAAGARATLAISGGTSPKPMFQYFSGADFPWDRVHLFWVDERCVPITDPQSNFKFAYDNWLRPASFPEANVHRVRTELSPALAAQAYTEEIQRFFGGDSLPRFEVMHLGMGSDGHTASLFPGDPLVHDRTHIATEVWVPKMNQWRVTLLPGVIEAARHIAMLAGGADKVAPFRAVMESTTDVLQYPAKLARSGQWFLDQAAAGRR